MTLDDMPYSELVKHNEQARLGLQNAVETDSEAAYRCSEVLEEKTRMERIRRARNREQPAHTGYNMQGYTELEQYTFVEMSDRDGTCIECDPSDTVDVRR